MDARAPRHGPAVRVPLGASKPRRGGVFGLHGIQEVPVDGEVSIAAAELPGSHGDPADRMVVATAILRALTLITADDVLLGWKLRGFKAQDATA